MKQHDKLLFTEIFRKISEAKKRIWILDNWICDNPVLLATEIEKALKRGVEVKIMLLNVFEPFGREVAKQRSSDISLIGEVKYPDDFVFNWVVDNIAVLEKISHSNYELKLFTCLPTVETYLFDDDCYVTNYLYNKLSKNCAHLEFTVPDKQEEENGYIKEIMDNFRKILKNASVLTASIPRELRRIQKK